MLLTHTYNNYKWCIQDSHITYPLIHVYSYIHRTLLTYFKYNTSNTDRTYFIIFYIFDIIPTFLNDGRQDNNLVH